MSQLKPSALSEIRLCTRARDVNDPNTCTKICTSFSFPSRKVTWSINSGHVSHSKHWSRVFTFQTYLAEDAWKRDWMRRLLAQTYLPCSHYQCSLGNPRCSTRSISFRLRQVRRLQDLSLQNRTQDHLSPFATRYKRIKGCSEVQSEHWHVVRVQLIRWLHRILDLHPE